jgi:pSer/pThr/pTyr-binding forkhead associated (FHA) protein
MGAPDEPELEDGTATGGLVVDDRQDDSAQRPPVGLLVFDDGATYTVDAEYLMGRMPEADPRVASGAIRSLALEDTSGAVSRVHAQIVLNGWEALLVDVGSRNGTFVSPPGEQGWTQLPAGETHLLVPGTRVRIGGRSFQFEAPSGTR